jgi:hypothetical protein
MSQLPPEALSALATIGVRADDERQLAFFDEIWRQEGPELFWGLVGNIRQRHELAVECFPRLCTFAESCRRERPPPSFHALTDVQLEEFRLITEAFRELGLKERSFQPQATNPLIITTSEVGLLAVPPLLPADAAFTTILLTEEFGAWRESLDGDSLCDPWWYEHWWCTVTLAQDDERLTDAYRIEDVAPLRKIGQVWELSCGSAGGALAAACSERLLVWNGISAVPTEHEAFWVA